MSKLVIQGGQRLAGEVVIAGAKNAALPILAATLLTDEESVISRVPRVGDTEAMVDVLRSIGVNVDWHDSSVVVNPGPSRRHVVPVEKMRTLRASICLLGPTLARLGRAHLALPGGCQFGHRPIDLHVKGLRALGAEIQFEDENLKAFTSGRLKGNRVDLAGPHGSSVLATANTLLAATTADGRTTIDNAAREPEIVDLARCLQKMGAAVQGAGSAQITIDGVERLHGTSYEIIPDRIEAGTFLLAVTAAGGDIALNGVKPAHLEAPLAALKRVGTEIKLDGTTVRASRYDSIGPLNVVARPYPEFPTDLQAQWMAVMTLASGNCTIRDEVFPDRLSHVGQLRRMGADISVEGSQASVHGVGELLGASLEATDLRASAALVIAALAARGRSEVQNLSLLDRGYERFEAKLTALGADVVRVST